MKIYVSNLDFNVQDEDLESYFKPFGAVASATVINDRETGRSRGFGFVEMDNDTEAKEAIAKLDSSSINGRQIRVSEARPKPEKSFGKSNNFRNDGGYNKRKW